MSRRRTKQSLQAILLAAIACLSVLLHERQAIGQLVPSSGTAAATNLPTTVEFIDGVAVRIPDWSRITFRVLGTVNAGGSIPETLEGINLNAALGYEFSRIWEMGASLTEILKVGDVLNNAEGIWTIAEMSLNAIGEFSGRLDELQQIPISEVEFLKDLSLEDLQEAVPPEVAAEIESALAEVGAISAVAGDTLGVIGDGITLGDVPALMELAMAEFPEIENYFLDAVPFLEDVPIDRIADIVEDIPALVRFDALYGNPEGYTFDTISGGFSPLLPCDDPSNPNEVDCEGGNCPHIEIFQLGNFLPGRWVSGRAQKVAGGVGPLKAVGGGVEPTGRLPFGKAFKYAIWGIDSTTDILETRIFFRICVKNPFICTCTPYNIPPEGIPFIPFSRDDYSPA